MLIMFRLRDDMITPETAAGLVQKSFFWDLCEEWRVVPVGGELPDIDSSTEGEADD